MNSDASETNGGARVRPDTKPSEDKMGRPLLIFLLCLLCGPASAQVGDARFEYDLPLKGGQVGGGMAGRAGEQDARDMNPAQTAETARQYRDLIVGIKTAHYDGPEWIDVERAVEAGSLAGLPVMVDFGTFRPERPFQELALKKLRPGDIYTHTFLAPAPMLDEQYRVLPYLFEAMLRDGLVVYELNGLSRESWDRLGKYGSQGDSRWDGTHEDAKPKRNQKE